MKQCIQPTYDTARSQSQSLTKKLGPWKLKIRSLELANPCRADQHVRRHQLYPVDSLTGQDTHSSWASKIALCLCLSCIFPYQPLEMRATAQTLVLWPWFQQPQSCKDSSTPCLPTCKWNETGCLHLLTHVNLHDLPIPNPCKANRTGDPMVQCLATTCIFGQITKSWTKFMHIYAIWLVVDLPLWKI